MSRQVQTESAYVQTVPDSKCLCPDRPRRKVDMSRLSCVQNFSCVLRAFEDKYVQTIPDRNSICPDFRAFLSRPSCAPTQIRSFNAKFLVRPCPDHRAFMSRLSCVHQTEKKLTSCAIAKMPPIIYLPLKFQICKFVSHYTHKATNITKNAQKKGVKVFTYVFIIQSQVEVCLNDQTHPD